VPVALSPVLKHLESECNHLSSSSTKVKNEWSYTFTPLWTFMVYMGNFTFPFLYMLVIKINVYTITCTVYKKEGAVVHAKSTTLQTILPVCESEKAENKFYFTHHVTA
jgi:hypothetical protein